MAEPNRHMADEQRLATACRDGGRPAQRQLYEHYVEYMMLVCLRYIPNREDAKEALLDGFVNVYKNIGRFEYRGEGSLKAWIKKIMVNQCLMFLRRRTLPIVPDEDYYDTGPSADTDALARLGMKELMQMIHGLPDGYRTVFNLNVLEGMTHKEIAELLGISENTSKSQLHKAKNLLQKTIIQTTKMS